MSAFLSTIRLRPGVSIKLAGLLAATHIGAAAVVAATSLNFWTKAVLMLGLGMSWAWSIWWHLWHRGDAIIEAVLDANGAWWVSTARRAAVSATLGQESLVQPFLTVLNFKLADGRRRSLVLFDDNCDAEAFRLVRVRLRIPPQDEAL